MKAIILQNESFEGPGIITEYFDSKNINYQIIHVFKENWIVEDEKVDLVVIMGGTASVYETDKFPYLLKVKEFIKNQFILGAKILGICLGAQFLAEMLGARVYPNEQQEIGWFPMKINVKELSTIGYSCFPESMNVLHWHGDTFDIPKGAVSFGSTEVTPNQGFIYKNQVFALQFHIETTETSLALMLENIGHTIKRDAFVQLPDEIRKGIDVIKENQKIMNEFLDLILHR